MRNSTRSDSAKPGHKKRKTFLKITVVATDFVMTSFMYINYFSRLLTLVLRRPVTRSLETRYPNFKKNNELKYSRIKFQESVPCTARRVHWHCGFSRHFIRVSLGTSKDKSMFEMNWKINNAIHFPSQMFTTSLVRVQYRRCQVSRYLTSVMTSHNAYDKTINAAHLKIVLHENTYCLVAVAFNAIPSWSHWFTELENQRNERE